MNILVLGNGFDLAHGLPTKYEHFLGFCERVVEIYDYSTSKNIEDNLKDWDINEEIKKTLKNVFVERAINNSDTEISKSIDELYELVKENVWIEYFLQNPMYQNKENWIDFESEISNVIKSIDEDMSGETLEEEVVILSNSFLKNKLLNSQADLYGEFLNGKKIKDKKPPITYKQLIELLDNDLTKLIRALEIYLDRYVGKLQVHESSPDIISLDVNRVLSFNYLDTYQRLYGVDKPIEYDYIHGKANINNTLESNNMVLGIDEYLPKDRRNIDIEFVSFKKYYQRIYKQTGCRYKHWLDIIKRDANKKTNFLYDNKDHSEDYAHRLYIFGHSLDITDGDILRGLILNDNVYTTIYYRNKETMGKQIANLVRVIGQDELIRRTGGSTKTIEFKLQTDMINKETTAED